MAQSISSAAADPSNPIPTGNLPGWKLAYTDDFSGNSLGSGWGIYSGQPGSDPLAIWDPSHVVVQNGILNLETSQDPAHPGLWTSGGVSLNTVPETYGMFEVHMRVTPGSGVSDIALLWPANNSWPPEIDFAENGGKGAQGTTATLHYGANNQMIHDSLSGVDFTQWQTIGVEWMPGEIDYTINGKVWATVKDANVPDIPMHLALQAQTLFANASTPAHSDMQIDWAAVYSYAPGTPGSTTSDPPPATGGTGSGSSGTTAGSGSSALPTGDSGTGPDTVTLHVSGDHWQAAPDGQPHPEFVVLIDGQQIGGVQTVTASHDAGQWQDVAVHGTFANPHQVEVKFLNDAWGGSHATDVNLYVQSITVDGQSIAGSHGANTATNGALPNDPGGATMDINGALTFAVPQGSGSASSGGSGSAGSGSVVLGTTAGSGSSAPPTGDPGTGPDTVTLHVSGDHWQAAPDGQPHPEFVVLVDGQQVGGVQTVTASHDAGQWQDVAVHGTFANPHQVEVKFLNDAWGGSHATDVNLYVQSITVDGQSIAGSHGANTATNGALPNDPGGATMDINGALTFAVPALGGASVSHSATSTISGLAATGSTAPVATSTLTSSASPILASNFTDGSGHDIFVFHSLSGAGGQIAAFDPAHDVLDLAPLLSAVGYKGSNPVADHVLALAQSDSDSTAVMVDPHGHDPSHGTTLVTLDHILPKSVPAADFWH